MKITTELLPPLPAAAAGREWIAQLRHDGWWQPVGSWGNEGGDRGDRRSVAIAHFTGRTVFAVAVYLDGDVTVMAFDDAVERDACTDEFVVLHWRACGNGPSGLLTGYHDPHRCGSVTVSVRRG